MVTSLSLLAQQWRRLGLPDRHCVALGPPRALEHLREEGLRACLPSEAEKLDALVILDESGFDFLGEVDRALSLLLAAGQPCLVLCNPDLVFPKSGGSFGITAGAIAELLENVLRRQWRRPFHFLRLGKPHAPIFAAGAQLCGTSPLVMLGDQLQTDIAGAKAFGIDSVLLGTGVDTIEQIDVDNAPSFFLSRLS